MIAPMKKVIVVSRGASREELLLALRELGVLHLEPADPMAAAPDKLLAELALVRRSRQAIGSVEPSGRKPDLDAHAAAEEILSIVRRGEEGRNRLSVLAREAARAGLWGDLRLEQLQAIAEAGVPVKFYMVPAKLMSQVEAECVAALADLPGKQVLAAMVQREGEPSLPEEAEPVQPPQRNLPTIRAEAKELDAALAADGERLADLASLGDELAAEARRLAAEGEFAAARAGGLQGGDLYALQGWAPIEAAETLAGDLAAAGLRAALQVRDPGTDEEPPTLIRYPRWVKPIKGLFDVLGTVAGYREADVSIPFLIALPIFAAMLIGDGGYGAILFLGPLLFWKKASKLLGREFARLLTIVGAVTLVWGLLSASFFGVVLYKPLIPVNMTDASRDLLMRISFYMGAVHLAVAQIWRGATLWPSLKSLSCLGWAIFVWGMLGVVNYFVLDEPLSMSTPWPYLLMAGAALAILFDAPSKNPIKMVGLGLANFPLSMLSTFSDVISYVRLMAVGLASGVLASSFNELALSAGPWIIAAPILILGHGLNLGLALIALFAHGVRLNMLEFSNNLGMQWTGRLYQPFAKPIPEEIKI